MVAQRPLDRLRAASAGGNRRPPSGRVPAWFWRTAAIWALEHAVVVLAIVAATVAKPRPLSFYWGRWDSFWYLRVAEHGYPHDVYRPLAGHSFNEIAFFPGFPLLDRMVGVALGGHYLVAGVVINLVLSLVLLCLVRVLFCSLAGPVAADRGVVLYALFWGTSVFTLAYAEPLALVAATGCLLALLSRRWLLAGALAALATATRPSMVVALGLSCAVAAGIAVVRRRKWRALVAPVLSPVGALAFFAYLGAHTGDLLAWQHNESRLWGQHLDGGVQLPGLVWDRLVHPRYDGSPYYLLILTGAVVVVAGVVALWRVRPPLLVWAYVAGIVVPTLLDSSLGPQPRFVAAAFPLFLGLGALLGRRLSLLVAAGSAVLLFGATVLYLGGTSGGF